jgi:hypothetical protein
VVAGFDIFHRSRGYFQAAASNPAAVHVGRNGEGCVKGPGHDALLDGKARFVAITIPLQEWNQERIRFNDNVRAGIAQQAVYQTRHYADAPSQFKHSRVAGQVFADKRALRQFVSVDRKTAPHRPCRMLAGNLKRQAFRSVHAAAEIKVAAGSVLCDAVDVPADGAGVQSLANVGSFLQNLHGFPYRGGRGGACAMSGRLYQ